MSKNIIRLPFGIKLKVKTCIIDPSPGIAERFSTVSEYFVNGRQVAFWHYDSKAGKLEIIGI